MPRGILNTAPLRADHWKTAHRWLVIMIHHLYDLIIAQQDTVKFDYVATG